MFRLSGSSFQSGSPSQRYVKRAIAFGAGLIVLWLALQFVPSSPPPVPPAVSDNAGTVVSNLARPERSTGGFFSFGYIVVILLLGGGVVLALKLHRSGTPTPFQGSPLRSAGQLYLGPNQQIRLVTVGEDVLLLGVTSGQITLLARYPKSILETPAAEGDGMAVPAPSFSTLLRQYGVNPDQAR